jgi:hypothetical protein
LEGKFYASKTFSVIREDWEMLNYSETIKEKEIISKSFVMKPQLGIDISFSTKNLLNQTFSRFLMPENGRRSKIPKGIMLMCVDF